MLLDTSRDLRGYVDMKYCILYNGQPSQARLDDFLPKNEKYSFYHY